MCSQLSTFTERSHFSPRSGPGEDDGSGLGGCEAEGQEAERIRDHQCPMLQAVPTSGEPAPHVEAALGSGQLEDRYVNPHPGDLLPEDRVWAPSRD